MIITYELTGRAVDRYGGWPLAGDVVTPMSRRTGKPTGTRYLVTRVASVRAEPELVRCRLVCERIDGVEEGMAPRTWPLWWFPRGRRR